MKAMSDDILKTLFSEQEIKAKIKEIGLQITQDYKDKDLTVISILKGSVVFLVDLMRAIDLYSEIDFMVVSSFDGIVSTGVVRIMKDLSISIENKDILIVEDILDSGKTLEYITTILKGRNPRSIKICTLLDKPSRRLADIKPDYSGFEVPDEFVVGYGLDYNEKYRNLPYIGVLKPDVYTTKDSDILSDNRK